MKLNKRFFSLLLAVALILGMMPVHALATDSGDAAEKCEFCQVELVEGAEHNELCPVRFMNEFETQTAGEDPSEGEPAPTETEPAPTETEPAPTETEPAPTETEPAPTETEPAPTETEPAPTETEPAPTETEPAPTETEPAPTEDTTSSGPQVGDKIWIKSGSKTYVNPDRGDEWGNSRDVLFNYETTVVSIIADENGVPQWYEFEPTGLLQIFAAFKYVKAENTTTENPDDLEPEVVEKEIVVNGTSVVVSGAIPEDVTLTVEALEVPDSLVAEDESEESKMVFAYDIKLLNPDGSEWQPESGETVSVTLDVASIGLEDGTTIRIVHEHDDELNELGDYSVENSKLTFVTGGFSVFYGYEVEFEYDGEWHVISGGSYIYLSELFEELGIERSVNDVQNVTFSDETLIEISHLTYIQEEGGGQDWRLIAIEPFDTEETLTISFADEEIIIKVYDKNWGTANIQGNETWANGDTQGNRKVTVSSTITVNNGATVTLNGTISIPEGKTLTIICAGSATLKRGANNTGNSPLFHVEGGKLEIKSTGGILTVDGSSIAVGRAAFVVGRNHKEDNGSTLHLTNVKIKNCYSSNNGYAGAIQLVTGDYKPIHDLQMSNCVVENCRAPHGSAIYFRGSSRGRAYITDTVFQNCVAYGKLTTDGDDQGGTIRSNGQNGSFVVLERCIIRNNRSGYSDLNTAKTGSRCYGGGIYWNAAGALSSVYRDTIVTSNNRAKMYLFDCQVLDNKATNRGGGIFNEAAMYIGTRYDSGFTTTEMTSTSSIRGTLIDGNFAGGYSGSTISGNCGGGLMVPSYGGGAEESKDMDVMIDIGTGVFITNNESTHGGGFAMQINQTDDKNAGVTFSINYDGAVISNNIATQNGGGMYFVMMTNLYNANLDLVSGTISNNDARNGGGIYVENTNINIGTENTTPEKPIMITGNEATNNGGGIYLKQESAYQDTVLIKVSDGFVTDNSALLSGGGIYQIGEIGNCIVEGEGEISSNTASNGGGLYIDGGSNLNVTGGIITENYAVCAHSPENHICTPAIHSADTAKGNSSGVGGGVYVANGSLELRAEDGSQVGLYGNIADFAADDAYASSSNSYLKLPNVEGMPLAGTAYAAVDGWYIDYCEEDTNYPASLYDNHANPGRYRSLDGERISAGESVEGDEYYCLTLGRTPTLVIEKHVPGSVKPDETFRFTVKKGNDDLATVELKPADFEMDSEKNEWVATHTISKMPVGAITVTETMKDNTRFEFVSATADVSSNETVSETTIEFTMTDDGEKVIYTNKYSITDITITKTVYNASADVDSEENQTFFFHVKGNDENSKVVDMTVVINISQVDNNGTGTGSVTIKNVPVGSYTVTELENWSWRYDETNGGIVTKTITGNAESETNKFGFENDREIIYWLSGDSYCENWWGGDNGAVLRRDDD